MRLNARVELTNLSMEHICVSKQIVSSFIVTECISQSVEIAGGYVVDGLRACMQREVSYKNRDETG